MSIAEAIKGAQVEFGCTRGWLPRLRCIRRLTAILTHEILSPLTMASYGMKALCIRHNLVSYLPSILQWSTSRQRITSGRYGMKPRNVVDIYHPRNESPWSPSWLTKDLENPESVVLFVHGGVWSSGERWHYAPLASTLAQENVAVGVMSYTLYPEASASEISDEINDALDWFMHNHTTKSQKVTLVGHSSGAHCVMMAMLNRAKHGKEMPNQVICISGVYDISQHYQFEKARGVHEISMMKRAVGGFHKFQSMSPTCILTDPLRSNFDPCIVQTLPKIVLISSLTDHVVPSVQSQELHEALQELGCDSRFLRYENIVHSHFVTKCWTTLNSNFVSDFLALLKPQNPTSTKEALNVLSEHML